MSNTERITLMKKWFAITGEPLYPFALNRYEEEVGEYEEAQGEAKLAELGDVAFCALQLYTLNPRMARPLWQYASDELNKHEAWAMLDATLTANLTKVTRVSSLSREDALEHAERLVSERYPAVEARPIDAGLEGRFWVWRCVSGENSGKVLKGPHFEPARIG